LDFCVVFFVLFVFVLCLVYIVVSFSGLSILDCPSVFSYVYFLTLKTYHYNTISSILFYSLQDFILSLIFQIYFFSINYLPFFADLFTYININIRLTYVIKFVSDSQQVGGFLRVLLFPPPIELTATI
jgi:hypothetical protein